jgi:eukaryotic translation initiation factor 2C
MLGSSRRNAQREGQTGGAPSATQSAAHLSLARFDGNRDPVPTGPAPQIIEGISNNVKNVDLGATMWAAARGARNAFQPRQPASKLGKEIKVQLNAFPVTGLPTKPIYQYSVQVGAGFEKRGLIKAVWNSEATKRTLGEGWIFDGQSLAWSHQKLTHNETRYNVNLDDEAGHRARPGRTDQHRVIVTLTAVIDFTTLNEYLSGKTDHDKKILQAITVLDHIMRESPSSRFISIKRSFFAAASQRNALGGHVEHTTGVYQSLRIAHHPGGARLVVNADVANGTFWSPGPVSRAVIAVTRLSSEAEIARLLVNNNPKFYDLRRLKKLRVFAAHRKGAIDDYVIDSVLRKDSSHILHIKDGPDQTVAQYFQTKHNIRLQYPAWPVVQMTKKAILPLELLKIKENQRYTFKLDEIQTSQMIKRAVTPPKERWTAISNGVNMLNWAQDPFLRNYGLTIENKPIEAKARLLTNPKLQFGGTGAASQTDPRTSGRWDLKGKKFASVPPANVLTTWGVCVVPANFQVDKPAIERFVKAFIQTYTAHGATLPPAMQNPVIHYPSNRDPASFAQEAFTAAGNKHQKRPQILMFILMNKDSTTYGRIKRYCECALGITSQCVQYAHVQKAQPQYISNVLMKFNAKLGGFTNTAFTAQTVKGNLDSSTVVIGADVSHSAPGLKGPSMAAMTVSMNVQGTRYAAAVETNGYRVEMITDENIKKHIISLVKNGWAPKVGQGKAPATVIYFRDGVSEGQFAQVIDKEVAAMKKAFLEIGASPKFMVIIASKRHHVRFFPQSGGDKNANALPGTLVETGVTQPYENDFYLCAHAAIKGTARPVHYNVLLNEPQWPNEKIQTLIYEHSYQYIRATTPVSIFPAVYYAHIASLRGAHHSKGFGVVDDQHTVMSPSIAPGVADPEAYPPLMPMGNPAVMNPSMWYI